MDSKIIFDLTSSKKEIGFLIKSSGVLQNQITLQGIPPKHRPSNIRY